jgi:peptidyl-prolyl cis-trans isomerase SurA
LRKLVVIALLFSINAWAQPKIVEEIVAVVGDFVVLKSDLDAEYEQAKASMDMYDGDLKCEVLNQLIIQKLYLHKGKVDSTYASEDRVNAEVDRRIQYYASQIGGEKKLEQYLGKSIAEYKLVMKPKIEQQMIAQQVQQQLVADVKASPTDVREFYNEIPKDSLPEFGEEVEVAQLVMAPKPSSFAKEYALEKIQGIRKDIMRGLYEFEHAAKSQSDDKGTAINGGEIGYFGRGQMVGAFERAAFKLPPDSISEVIETEYGYHIIQVIDRKGEKVNARHILIKPLIVNSDFTALVKEMDSLVVEVKNERLSWCKLATDYSSDPYTKDNCGYFTDPTTGAQQVPEASLDPQVASTIASMQEGEFSKPQRFMQYDGTQAYRLVYLNKRYPAHRANLKDDYQKIQALAEEKKKDRVINDWVENYRKDVYVWIDNKYRNCKELEGWKSQNN